jgi:hypothetical protein
VVAAAPACVYLTHYGRVEEVAAHAAGLHAMVHGFRAGATAVGRAGAAADPAGRHAALRDVVERAGLADLDRVGCAAGAAARRAAIASDVEINAQGLAAWLDKEAAARL